MKKDIEVEAAEGGLSYLGAISGVYIWGRDGVSRVDERAATKSRDGKVDRQSGWEVVVDAVRPMEENRKEIAGPGWQEVPLEYANCHYKSD
jgi:hypothetical protein